MAWLLTKTVYDRDRVLKQARRAAKRGEHSKAAALYAELRRAEPDNMDFVRRAAMHRVRGSKPNEALHDCLVAAMKLARRGSIAEAIGILREFAKLHPQNVDVWKSIAALEIERERTPDAVGVLVEGSRHFRSHSRTQDGLALLTRARLMDPTHFEASFELADLTWRRGGGARVARRLLESLVPHARTRCHRRRLRARQFRLCPTPAAAWRWLGVLFGG
jgi:tetratricopeptide (TPR) repeat protein